MIELFGMLAVMLGGMFIIWLLGNIFPSHPTSPSDIHPGSHIMSARKEQTPESTQNDDWMCDGNRGRDLFNNDHQLDPAYSFEPDNIFHDDHRFDPAYSFEPDNIYHDHSRF